jgi:hypothetical protein
MMLLLAKGVECSQKIAMTTLRHGPATIGLLPDHRLPRRVFFPRPRRTTLSIAKRAEEFDWHEVAIETASIGADVCDLG